MLLATAAAKDEELRHFDAEPAFVKTGIDEDIYIKVPKDNQEFPGTVGLPNKAIYGLVLTGWCWNNKFCDMMAIGFKQSKAGPCVFRKVTGGKVDIVVVVHVDDVLVHAKDQATMERFTAELGRKFKLKSIDDAKFCMGCHITRNRKARELKLDQHLTRIEGEKARRASSGVPTLSKANE